ncbi:Beta-lactamase-like protein [Corchorus capsularis]|uniref:Beta-lactamase-like protein n=1 Tax=Corchorus capsularis TaxID=210143 RepID=A0A1R3I2X4_COCAP|nr:Beta-lactamase-like protein [Corchorus capsularis]
MANPKQVIAATPLHQAMEYETTVNGGAPVKEDHQRRRAGNEVGRSCVYMSYKGKNVLFDCGIHPAYSGCAALPYFEEIDPSTIDVLLITHFHLDHAASLPYFLEKTEFRGRVFMTHATKAIYKLLLTDYVKVSKVSKEDMLFDEQDINRSMDKIEVIDFHSLVEVNGIKFWSYTAGHVLGAAMFMVDIAGVRVLYTGDYSREEDRHLRAAELPELSPDICIIESTYGVQLHQPRHIREKRFTDVIHSTVSQGGRVLIPAFALGRAQELLLILDEYWSNHPEFHNIPIYYASPLARSTSTFLKELMPPNIILVHGEAKRMERLKLKLITEFTDGNTKIFTPKNCQSVEMYFNSETMAKTIGRLAEKTPEVVETVSDEESGVPTLLVHDRVTVKQDSDKHISLHWTSDPISDMVSDSIVALVLNISREIPKVVVEPEAVKTEEEYGKKAEKVIYAFLVSLFGDVQLGENGKLRISVDGKVAHLDKQSGEVESEDEDLKERVKTAFRGIQSAVKPIPLSAS